MDENQLNRNLIGQGKKGSHNYQKRLREIEMQIQILKNKNNMLQKQSDNDLDDQDLKKQIFKQSQFVEAQINKIKNMLEDFAQQFKDPAAKNKLKEMWKNASKEIERNKIITERIVCEAPRSSFISKEERYKSSIINEKNRKSKGQFERRRSRQSSEIFQDQKAIIKENEEDFNEYDLEFENQITRQKNQILNHLEQKNQKINKVMNQIALLVDQQGQNVHIITGNVNQTGENLVSANQELIEASIQQQKARKKYCCIAAFLVIAVIVGLGLYFIINGMKDQKK